MLAGGTLRGEGGRGARGTSSRESQSGYFLSGFEYSVESRRKTKKMKRNGVTVETKQLAFKDSRGQCTRTGTRKRRRRKIKRAVATWEFRTSFTDSERPWRGKAVKERICPVCEHTGDLLLPLGTPRDHAMQAPETKLATIPSATRRTALRDVIKREAPRNLSSNLRRLPGGRTPMATTATLIPYARLWCR